VACYNYILSTACDDKLIALFDLSVTPGCARGCVHGRRVLIGVWQLVSIRKFLKSERRKYASKKTKLVVSIVAYFSLFC
jgi:hypothetical protein